MIELVYNRKVHFFTEPAKLSEESVSMTPPRLYPQERDWTCSIACIRTMMSGIDKSFPTEDELVEQYELQPGPHYSRDIKRLGILENYDVVYGCDKTDVEFEDIIEFLKDDHYVMLECMVNYAHWLALLGYYTVDDYTDPEKNKLLLFDPYYNEVRMIRVDEFINMWIDGNYANSKVEKDFIAIKRG